MSRFLFLALLFLAGCQHKEPTLKIAATSVPHGEMLEFIRPEMEKRGYLLEIIIIDDYQLPNRLLAEGQVDANFFQHKPFFDAQKELYGNQLAIMECIHCEPLGIYSSRVKCLGELKNKAVIAIPSDPTNEARALLLLQKVGLICVKEDHLLLTPRDVVANPLSLRLQEVDAPLLARTLADVDCAVIPANFALAAGLAPCEDALALEEKNLTFQNILVIRRGEEGREDLKALALLLKGKEMEAYILRKYKGGLFLP